MPGAAARIGDQTIHGGVITSGAATVFIGGKPAARVGDMQSCPLVSGSVPHAATPILPPGVPIVMIEGRPAACMGDPVGPPCLAMLGPGEPTVVIGTCPPLPEIPSLRLGKFALAGALGDDGGGTGAEGAGSAGGGRDAAGAQENALAWIEIDFKQADGKIPAAGIKYRVICPDGSERAGYLNANGFAREENIDPPGICEISFPELDDSAWVKTGSQGANENDWIEITLFGSNAVPCSGEAIEVTLPNAAVIHSKLDENGHIRWDNIPSGTCKVRFPDLDESQVVDTAPGPVPEEKTGQLGN